MRKWEENLKLKSEDEETMERWDIIFHHSVIYFFLPGLCREEAGGVAVFL